MKKIAIILVVFLLILSFGCKKKLTDVNKDFVGLWYTKDKYVYPGSSSYKSINITESSSAEYNDRSGGSNKNVKGTARTKGSVLKIGLKKFTIDEEPVRLGNVGNYWRMKINGEDFFIDKDNLFSTSVNYCGAAFNVFNKGNDTINATIDGEMYAIPPSYSLSSFVGCFGCPSIYSDDHGNNFSYFNTGCFNTIEIH